MTILVTGGAGFIGTNFIIDWIANETSKIVNFDKLTYAGNLQNLTHINKDDRYSFVHGDILDQQFVEKTLEKYQPQAIVHFAAESHVDRSIVGPEDFMQTNLIGTFRLLEATRGYLTRLDSRSLDKFRFIHVSTDEVFGSLLNSDEPSTECTAYRPNSPYAASKAGSDHIVRAYYHTYRLPVITTNCSNNYGPYQFPEKLIPLMVVNALRGERLPVYGDGSNIRDWLYVGDHCSALRVVLDKGVVGETYNIGGNNEMSNLSVVKEICELVDQLAGKLNDQRREDLISFVEDRPGHDLRYAIDSTKTQALGWLPEESFSSGLRRTIQWYLDNTDWLESVQSGAYQQWVQSQYGELR